MPRRSTQQLQLEAAAQQLAAGIAGLFRLMIPTVPAASALPAQRQQRPPAATSSPAKHQARPPAASPKPRQKRKISAKARKQFMLQGAYMGLARRLSVTKKAELKKLRLAKGYEAAIAAARKMVKNK